MYKFTLTTDSTCDLYLDFLRGNDIPCAPLTFTVEEKDGSLRDYLDNFEREEEYIAFYDRLKNGAFSRTSKLNYQSHYDFFTAVAENGAKDVLHFTISSGLSSTKEIARRAADDVKKLYPKFNVWVVDPLTATVGQGALVEIALDCRNKGWTAQKTYEHVLSLRPYIQHFIVADDLNYLYRGGRVSAPSAKIGSLLNIKPMLTFDDEGKLTVLEKNKGMKKSIQSMLDKPLKMPIDRKFDAVYIIHTGNFEAAKELETRFVERYGIQPHVSVMGPIIGSHLGPNGLGFGYLSENLRNKY